DRVETDDVERRRRVGRLGRLPLALELAERAREAGREGVGDVVIAWDGQHGWAERPQEARGPCELIPVSAVAEVAAGNDELRLEPLDQYRCTALDCVVVTCAEVQIGQVENACKHGRRRLYTDFSDRRDRRDLRRPLS